jgi:hypothetical protein
LTTEETVVNNKLIVAALAGLLGTLDTGFAAESLDPSELKLQKEVFHQRLAQLSSEALGLNALEPCINGEVSASGLYPTQAEEDAALAAGRSVLAGR